MNAHTQVRTNGGHLHLNRLVRPRRGHRVRAVPVPSTPLLAGALAHVDWSDAYAVRVPPGLPVAPQQWADAIFRSPPAWIRILFGLRGLLVGAVGIERDGRHAFDTVATAGDEVLLGTDQRHLGFRASVLVRPGRVVLSTVVQVRNRRGRAYCLLVRRVHPLVVRGMLSQAVRQIAVST